MPSSSLPLAFSSRQNLPSSASSIKYPPMAEQALPLAAVPHPSSVRHRLRAVLPETLRDAEAESTSTAILDPLNVDTHSNHNNNNNTTTTTWHQPQPALQQMLTKGLPAESMLLLNVVAVIWGSQHPVIKMVVDDCDASAFSLLRFCFAAVIASIFAPPPMNFDDTTTTTNNNSTATAVLENDEDKTLSKAKLTWRWGAEMGLWMFLGYAFQAIGLEVRERLDTPLNRHFLPTHPSPALNIYSTHTIVYDCTTIRLSIVFKCQICTILCSNSLWTGNFDSHVGFGLCSRLWYCTFVVGRLVTRLECWGCMEYCSCSYFGHVYFEIRSSVRSRQ